MAIALLGSGLMGLGGRHASAQDDLAAAVFLGNCDDIGEAVADLRPLTVAEGGARTSFTTIDMAIDELTGAATRSSSAIPKRPPPAVRSRARATTSTWQ